jgi:RimJ/RimL family protein N-acetyltransferase
MLSQTDRPRKIQLWFQSGKYFARTIKREDASERWATWLADSQTAYVLNTSAQKLQKSDLVQYIKGFDQRSRLLIGIFERGTRLHIGIIRLDIDYAAKDALVNAVIGESEHRNKGATVDVFIPMLDYLFDTVGLEKVRASILRRNQVTMRYLLKLGWQLDESKNRIKSNSDDMLDMCLVSYTREAFRIFKQSKLGQRILQRLKQAQRAAAH